MFTKNLKCVINSKNSSFRAISKLTFTKQNYGDQPVKLCMKNTYLTKLWKEEAVFWSNVYHSPCPTKMSIIFDIFVKDFLFILFNHDFLYSFNAQWSTKAEKSKINHKWTNSNSTKDNTVLYYLWTALNIGWLIFVVNLSVAEWIYQSIWISL